MLPGHTFDSVLGDRGRYWAVGICLLPAWITAVLFRCCAAISYSVVTDSRTSCPVAMQNRTAVIPRQQVPGSVIIHTFQRQAATAIGKLLLHHIAEETASCGPVVRSAPGVPTEGSAHGGTPHLRVPPLSLDSSYNARGMSRSAQHIKLGLLEAGEAAAMDRTTGIDTAGQDKWLRPC